MILKSFAIIVHYVQDAMGMLIGLLAHRTKLPQEEVSDEASSFFGELTDFNPYLL